MNKRKKLALVFLVLGLATFLTGCSEINQPITTESAGIWNQYFVYPLSWLITYVAGVFQSVNYGAAIIIVTVLVRIVLLPLMMKQMKSSRAMQEIQPEMQKLKEKYSSKDQKTQEKLQKETMILFQKHNVNPMAGCLPIFIQMPILMAFYHAIMRTPEIKEHAFLWFDLGSKDPYYILPIVAAVATFIQQKMMMKGQAQDNPQMKMMLYIMPAMILMFAISLPAALSLYWVVGNLFSIGQTFLLGRPKKKTESTQ